MKGVTRGGLAVCVMWVAAPSSVAVAVECRCWDVEPKVERPVCENGKPTLPRIRVNGELRDLTEQQREDVLLAYEMWDGTRLKDARCDEFGKIVGGKGRTPGLGEPLVAQFERMTGLTAALSVIGPNAVFRSPREDVPVVRRGAVTCAGPPVTILLPVETIRSALEAGGPALLAFILGHELGHRASALRPEGDRCFDAHEIREKLLALNLKGTPDLEVLADYRAAFYAALAGYDVAPLAKKKGVIENFLDHLGVRPEEREQRAQVLQKALQDANAFAGVYQTAIFLMASGDAPSAIVLLEWLDGLLRVDDVAIPEVKLALALALMARVGPEGPWFQGAPREFQALACVPVFPLRPAMHEKLGQMAVLGGLRGPAGRTREDAVRELERAKRLLEEASALGLSPMVVASAQACVALYLGDAKLALEQQRRVEQLAGNNVPEVVRETLAANGTIIRCASGSAHGSAQGGGRWERMANCLQRNSPALADQLKRYAKKGPQAEVAGEPSRDVGAAESLVAGLQVPEAPKFPEIVGQCPASYRYEFSLPDPRVAQEQGSRYGVTACSLEGSSHVWAIRVRLMSTDRPPYDGLDKVIFVVREPPAPANGLDAWEKACGYVERCGVSDRGSEVYRVACHLGGTVRRIALLTEKRKVVAVIVP